MTTGEFALGVEPQQRHGVEPRWPWPRYFAAAITGCPHFGRTKCPKAIVPHLLHADRAGIVAPDNTSVATISARSACSKCGTRSPSDISSCPKCGQPVMAKENSAAMASAVADAMALLRARRRGRILMWSFVPVLLGALLWVATSQSPAAQEVQEFVHWSQAQTIVDAQAAWNPHSVWSHEFTVPPGALDVSVSGEFTALPNSPRQGNSRGTGSGKDHDSGIEAYVLTNSAFVVWSGGYRPRPCTRAAP